MMNLNKSNNNIITVKNLKEAFQRYSIDHKYLSLQRFNDTLEFLFKPPIPVIHHTYLSQKIFYIIDSNKSGQIDENIFCQSLINILKDRNYRIYLSMQGMMNIPDNNKNFVEINEIKSFIFNSYIEGFKVLSKLINLNKDELRRRNLPIANENQLVSWAKTNQGILYNKVESDIKSLDNRITNKLDYNQFVQWINQDHTLYLQYAHIYLPVSTSLLVLDKVKFDDFELRKMIPNQNNNNKNKSINKNEETSDYNLDVKREKTSANEEMNINSNEVKNIVKKKVEDDFGFVLMTKDEFV